MLGEKRGNESDSNRDLFKKIEIRDLIDVSKHFQNGDMSRQNLSAIFSLHLYLYRIHDFLMFLFCSTPYCHNIFLVMIT